MRQTLSTMVEIVTKVVLILIHSRPVLWDKTLDVYKDWIATKISWREVYLELKQEFNSTEDKEKND